MEYGSELSWGGEHLNSKRMHTPASLPVSVFEEYVLTTDKLKNLLPGLTYRELQKQMKDKRVLDNQIADVVAHAAKDWAISHGATHFTHTFIPQTGGGAEKHDSFFSFSKQTFNELGKPEPISMFTGAELLQSEPDASSFPHGGLRTTFEARGYTIWDTSSPLYLSPTPIGTRVLCIPSIFISYTGLVMDEKTILLRSELALQDSVLGILKCMGDSSTKYIRSNLGVEQEFFLVNKRVCQARPDLKLIGATLFGRTPPKHQQLEDHYFKKIPELELRVIAEAEIEMYKFGIPAKTRHSEVAPKQFEMAPIFEASSLASEHNLLTMNIIRSVAHKYDLEVLYNEKPFKGVNGSGKHCNWSVSTNTGMNLLNPKLSGQHQMYFMVFLVACLNAVYGFGELLLASITSSSNRHRLGSSEAPPGVISVFLGTELSNYLDFLENCTFEEMKSYGKTPKITSVGTKIDPVLDIKLPCLPQVPRDLTDRNRTSPFAFTGNKFEFRAVGSKILPYFPVTLLNSSVAATLKMFTKELEPFKDKDGVVPDEHIFKLVQKYIKITKPVRFEGNNYSEEWLIEAKKRGLAVTNENFIMNYKALVSTKALNILIENNIFDKEELSSRYRILVEKYIMDIKIEVNTIILMVESQIVPSILKYKKFLLELINLEKQASIKDKGTTHEAETLGKLNQIINDLNAETSSLKSVIASCEGLEMDDVAKEVITLERLVDKIGLLLSTAEGLVPKDYWPYPTYLDIFF